MTLTDAKLRTLTKPGKHFDGAGLYVEVTAAGRRYWRLKYRFAGKEKRLALGIYPETSLSQARDLAAQARQALKNGEDPGALRKAAKMKARHESANTLRAVALDWMAHQKARWDEGTAGRILRSLELHAFPKLGNRPLETITPAELRRAAQAVEAAGAGDMAGRVLQRLKAIFRWAATHGRLASNPMVDLVPAEVLKPRNVTNRAALPERDLPEFLRKLDAYQGDPSTIGAMRLLLLTATRPGEVRFARWAEFDLDEALWIIPAERMKMRAEHRIPLSRQALEVLRAMQPLSAGRELVFPSPQAPRKPISENTLNLMLRRMGFGDVATAHGFRALFSTMANEAAWPADVIERALAHVPGNKVRATYNRASYMKERARLLQWWADTLDQKREGSNVLPLPARTAKA